MDKRPWYDFEIEALQNLYATQPMTLLVQLFKRSRESIKCKAQSLGLRKQACKAYVWSEAHIALLRARYPDDRAATLAAEIGVPVHSVYKKAEALGLKKSAAFYAAGNGRFTGESGMSHRFQPGQQAWNKGKKGLTLGGVATQFKPGHRGGRAAEIYRPIGDEEIRDGYLYRKVSDTGVMHKRWRLVHVINWEAVHGPVPAGHLLHFLDGNRMNTAVENLELVSRRDWLKRHTIHNYPKEIFQVTQLRGALKRRINRLEKANG